MIKDKVSEYFEYPMLNMSFKTYLEFLNTSGKITARSTMDLLAIILEQLSENERRVDEKK